MADSRCAPDHIRGSVLVKIGGSFIRVMASFAIDLSEENGYNVEVPEGMSVTIIENKQLA